MASSSPTELETTPQPSPRDSTLARALAPEDVCAGDYLAVLDEMYEYPSYCWFADAALLPPHELIRLRYIPRDEARPLKVLSICLPFVLTKDPAGNHRTLDLRRTRVARLSHHFATRARKALKKKPTTIT